MRRSNVDSLFYALEHLHHLVSVMGAGQHLRRRLSFGVSVEDPVERLGAAGLDAVRGGNPIRLLGRSRPRGGVAQQEC